MTTYTMSTGAGGIITFQPVEISVPSGRRRLEIPWLSQLGPEAAYSNNDCGPADVAMIARWRGETLATVDTASRATGLAKGYAYTMPGHLITAARVFGINLAQATGLTISGLKADVDLGYPTIVLVHYATLPKRWDAKYKIGHWILVNGYTEVGTVLYHDPYWPDSTGRYIEITNDLLLRAMADCRLDGNTVNQGLRMAG